MLAYTTFIPDVITPLHNGEYAVSIDTVPYKENGKNGYVSLRLDFTASELTSDNVIESFVRTKYTQSEEFSLINAYQSSKLGFDPDEEKEQEYEDFLKWRIAMKKTVKEAIANFVIETPEAEAEGKAKGEDENE